MIFFVYFLNLSVCISSYGLYSLMFWMLLFHLLVKWSFFCFCTNFNLTLFVVYFFNWNIIFKYSCLFIFHFLTCYASFCGHFALLLITICHINADRCWFSFVILWSLASLDSSCTFICVYHFKCSYIIYIYILVKNINSLIWLYFELMGLSAFAHKANKGLFSW